MKKIFFAIIMAVCLLGMQTPKLFAQAPIASFTTSATELCAGETIMFYNNTDPGAGYSQTDLDYDWYFGWGATPTNYYGYFDSLEVHYNGANSYQPTLNVTNTTNWYGNSFTGDAINVHEIPWTNIYSSGSQIDCNHSSVLLNCTAGIDATFEWYHNSNLVGMTDSLIATEQGDYSVNATSSYGCVTTNPAHWWVNYHTPPVVNLSSNFGNINSVDTFCSNLQVSLYSYWNGGYGQITQQWNDGGTDWSEDVTGSGDYYIVITDADGCISSDTAHIHIAPLPNATITPGPTTFCHGDTSSATANYDPTYTYMWSTNATTNSIPIYWGGYYFVNIMNESGCQSSAEVIFTEVYAPVPTAYANGNQIAAQVNDPIDHFNWYSLATGLVAGANDALFVAPSPGYYYATSVNSQGCESNSSNYVFASFATGITEIDETTGVAIIQDGDQIQIFSPTSQAQVVLVNIAGQVLWNQSFKNQTEFQTRNLFSGVYLVAIATDKGKFVKKILVE